MCLYVLREKCTGVQKTVHSARCAKHPALFTFAAQIFPAEDILCVAQK